MNFLHGQEMQLSLLCHKEVDQQDPNLLSEVIHWSLFQAFLDPPLTPSSLETPGRVLGHRSTSQLSRLSTLLHLPLDNKGAEKVQPGENNFSLLPPFVICGIQPSKSIQQTLAFLSDQGSIWQSVQSVLMHCGHSGESQDKLLPMTLVCTVCLLNVGLFASCG